MAPDSLTLPPRARRPMYRRVSLPRVLTGVAWIVVGASLGTICVVTAPGDALARLLWPAMSVVALLGGAGMLFGRHWARFVVAPVAVVSGLFAAFVSVAAPYPLLWWWWVGPIFLSFCAWTILMVTRLWGDFGAS